MPFAGIDTDTIRDAAFQLRRTQTTISTVIGDLASAATLAALHTETGTARALAVELDEEIDLLQRILDTKASAMELADAGFSTGGAYLLDEISRLSTQLQLSLDDQTGFHGTDAELRNHYQAKALAAAGIDLADWQPELGLDANREIIEAVYEYYASLYRSDPDSLWWAGMAATIGPSFLGGFRDLEMFADIVREGGDLTGQLSRLGGPASAAAGVIAEMSAEDLEREMRWYQSRLLMMQQEIFLDMATAHEAYRDGGMLAIERLYSNDDYLFGPSTIGAWQQIDDGRRTGRPDLVAEGNANLLYREQRYVIDDDYIKMQSRPVTGDAVTYLMTAVGAPSVPGARSFGEVFPFTVEARQYVGTPKEVPIIPFLWHQSVPHAGVEATVTVETPFPDGNIAGFDDRWALIKDDTLPVWADLAEHHQDQVLDLLDIPVGERARQFQFQSRAGELASWYLHDGWDLDVDLRPVAGS